MMPQNPNASLKHNYIDLVYVRSTILLFLDSNKITNLRHNINLKKILMFYLK